VNLSRLSEKFKSGEEVTPETLLERSVIRNLKWPVKILGTGELKESLKISAHAFSKTAQTKIEAAKGTTTTLPWKTKSSRKAA
jgi:large subunit ribosomal protein L15